MFSARKQSVSNKCFLCESEASATNVFCAKAKRQQQSARSEQKSITRYGDESKLALFYKNNPITKLLA
ncbi:hypothetical protein ACIQ57_01975 [Lysinibacillus xylanilyticus]|uniref:hypothetical protein n=1 Tax=Lysinibacillus xylanilyticus TaxID=582475 RepID=UPI0038097E5D